MKSLILIGGPADGRTVELEDGQDEYRVPKPTDPICWVDGRPIQIDEPDYEIYRYKLQRFWAGSAAVEVLAAEGLNMLGILQALVNGYRKL